VKALHHPHIVTCCGACWNSANTMMVTELLPFSLFDILYQLPNVTLQICQCVKIAIDICRAFRYLHSRTPQIIHR
jgi:serine/threonine protein kinase